MLANYEWDQKPLLSLVLVGLPELHDRMRLRRNRSLWSRIHCRLDLGEAAPEDTAEYLDARLADVGSEAAVVFDSDAVAMLHEATAGRLRDLDRLATDCIKRAARRKLKRVDGALVQHVAKATA